MNRYRIILRDDILEFDALDVLNAVMIATKTKGYDLDSIEAVLKIS